MLEKLIKRRSRLVKHETCAALAAQSDDLLGVRVEPLEDGFLGRVVECLLELVEDVGAVPPEGGAADGVPGTAESRPGTSTVLVLDARKSVDGAEQQRSGDDEPQHGGRGDEERTADAHVLIAGEPMIRSESPNRQSDDASGEPIEIGR